MEGAMEGQDGPTPATSPDAISVSDEFGRRADYYHAHAEAQRHAAQRLIETLRRSRHELPDGPALEVGCGTGFISEPLLRLLPDRRLDVTDLSEEMVRFCARRLDAESTPRLSVYRADGEYPGWNGTRYALIAAGFVAQWFEDPPAGLSRLATMLRPGGMLVASMPGAGSFPEWRRACLQAGVPCTARELPGVHDVEPALSNEGFQVDCTVETFAESHASPLSFLRHLKRMGAGSAPEQRPLSPSELRRLQEAWDVGPDGLVTVSYEVILIRVRQAL